jgi:hypothetical protein
VVTEIERPAVRQAIAGDAQACVDIAKGLAAYVAPDVTRRR